MSRRSMFRIGMWNTGQKPVAGMIAELAAEHQLNFILLLENGDSRATLLEALAMTTRWLWHLPPSLCERVTLLTRFPAAMVVALKESDKYTIRRISLPGLPETLLVVTHLRSRLRQAERSQVLSTYSLVEAITAAEISVGHSRTVVAGDFNMDPYDDGMLGAGALHAMMTRRRVLHRQRKVEGREYKMFYNPMWSYLGDRPDRPPGTYRYWSSEHVCREWHAFDQVLLRPDLIEAFPEEGLRVLTKIGSTSLLTPKGVPTPSDHLPIVFELLEPGGAHE